MGGREVILLGLVSMAFFSGGTFGAEDGSIPHEETSVRKPDLVEIIRLDPTIKLDIRYATTNNFTGRAVYREARAFLQRPAAEALVRAHKRVHKEGFGLLVFDGYRPLSVVALFWKSVAEENKRFVSDPAYGSAHSRGCAVDLSLYHLKSGKVVRMPGEFDEWSERSHSEYPGGTMKARWLRKVLRDAMEAEGFEHCEHEWWHFTYKDWEKYENLDVEFSELGGDGG
jgi:zinc D-Ala-D-Ala dipeptidase